MPDPNPADAMMQIVDGMTTLLEAVTGYRAKCEAAGFSPTASESMAEELHSALIVKVFGLAPSD